MRLLALQLGVALLSKGYFWTRARTCDGLWNCVLTVCVSQCMLQITHGNTPVDKDRPESVLKQYSGFLFIELFHGLVNLVDL